MVTEVIMTIPSLPVKLDTGTTDSTKRTIQTPAKLECPTGDRRGGTRPMVSVIVPTVPSSWVKGIGAPVYSVSCLASRKMFLTPDGLTAEDTLAQTI